VIEDVERALRLQETDLKIAALQAEIAQLPKHVAQIEKQLESHLRRLEKDQAALSANVKERKQRELDIQAQQQKISKLRDQMMLAKTNEQYRAFQHEIEYCENEIRQAEDRILDLMAESEPLEAAVKAAEAALAVEKKQVEQEKAAAKKRTDEDRAALAAEQQKRQELFEAMPPALRTVFERLKKRHANGLVVADATNGTCAGCRLALRPKYFQDLKHATTVMFCENCGRILRYDPPIDAQAMYEGGTRVSMS
jgi:predicted  nucleic acid-binding Zn-ribbon protein